MRFIFFAPAIFLFYAGMCAYIGIKLFGFFHHFFPGLKAVTFWIPFALLCFAFVFTNFFRHNLFILRQAGLYWLAIFVYLLMFFVISDIFRMAVHLAGKKIPNFNFYSICVSLALCFLIIVYGIIHARSLRTVNYRVDLRGEGDNIRIALISDLHIGSSIGKSWVEKVVNIINSEKPDMVCIAGDLFDGNLNIVDDLPGIAAQFKRLNAPLGVYACQGNHDVNRMFNGGTNQIEEFLESAGVIFLLDDSRAVRENLHIAGRRDARPIGMNAQRKTAEELFEGLEGTIIVLDHQPTQFEQIEKAGASLVFSGHTHAGQLFPANLITLNMFKKAGAVHHGYWKGRTLKGIVTSGVGFWGPPIRIGTNSEVAIIDVDFVLEY